MSEGEGEIRDIKSMRTGKLLELFKTLDAPDLEEMNGEYGASVLRQRNVLLSVAGPVSISNPAYPGKWLCKAFRPVGENRGRGYNAFKHFGRVVQRWPMLTVIAPSRYDGNPAYQLVYRRYRSLCGDVHMVDEVRRLEEGVYLGIGTMGYSHAQRQIPLPFLLTGPIGSYRGDIGVERASFELAKEIPALAPEASE